MRPSKIVIEGLRSFRKRVEIDFRDKRLLAIVGDTGAGKSSILEAITFALYGSSTWSGRDQRPLISDTADDMLVELTFNAEGETYVARRTASRRRPSTTELQCLTDGTAVDNAGPVNAEILRLVGLDREAFLKTVILPQGRFAELLNSTRGERDEVLKNIFRVDELERVRNHARDLRERLLRPVFELKARRDQLPDDPAGALQDAREAQTEARATADHLVKLKTSADEQRRTIELAERSAQAARAAVSRLDRDAPTSLKTRLTGLLARSESLHNARKGLQGNFDRAAAEQRAQEEERQAATSDGLDSPDLAKAETTLRGIATALSDVAGELATLTGDRETLGRSTTELSPLRREAAWAKRVTAAAERAVGTARTSREEAEQSVHQAELQLSAARNAARAVTQAREALARRETALQRALTRQEKAASGLERARERAERRSSELEALERQHSAAHAASGVHAGDPCPICQRGLPADFTPPVAPALEEAKTRADAAAKQLDEATEARTRADEAARQSDEEVKGARSALDRCERDLGSAVSPLRASLKIKEVDLEERDEALLEQVRSALGVAKATEAERLAGQAEASKAQHKAEQSLRGAEQEVETIKTRVAERETRVRDLVGRLGRDVASLPPTLHVRLPFARPPEATDPATLDPAPIDARRTEIGSRLRQLQALDQRIADARRSTDTARDELTALDERIAREVTTPLGNARTDVAVLLEQLSSAAEALGEKSPAMRLKSSANIEGLLASAEQARERLSQLEKRAQEVAVEHDQVAEKARAGLADLLAQSEAPDIESLQQHASDATVQARLAAERARQAARDAREARTLDRKLGGGTQLVADLEKLLDLLRNSTFIGELLALRSRALVAAAAQRLHEMTGGRYAFADDFEILDQLTGQPRSARTLSGGESFLASLALALGMVDLAARAGGRLDALFLDEGFGALDASNASMAIDALEATAASGRMVAVISHLRAVAERINDVLIVVPHPEGSRVAWADEAARSELADEAMTAAVASLLA